MLMFVLCVYENVCVCVCAHMCMHVCVCACVCVCVVCETGEMESEVTIL